MLVEIAQALGPVDQDYLDEARQMQALSFAMHIPLVCFGVAFPAFVLGMEWLGRRRGDALLVALARRWSKAMVALFAIGVVTGTILSFELGLLWPEFMATHGDVFGLAFALEGFSFFAEAIFIAIYVYGWDRLSARAHMLAGIPVAIAGFTGSLFVLSVNGWMNHPSGFRMENGRAVDVEPFRALFANSYFWHELVHMYLAAFLVAGSVTAGVYAAARLRGRRDRYVRVAMAVPLMVAAITAPAQVVVGDWAAREVAENQPTKLAAFEGLETTQAGAPIHIGGWFDEARGDVRGGIAIPKLLSLLAFHDPNATVRGLDQVAPEDRPPVNVVRLAFATMVVPLRAASAVSQTAARYDGLTAGAGLAAVLASAAAGVATMIFVARHRLEPARWSAAVTVGAIVAGWALAQEPLLLPGLTVEQAAASDATMVALLVSLAIGAVILIPSLALLFGLVLRGRFDEPPAEPGSLERIAGNEPGSRAGVAAAAGATLGVPLMVFSDPGVGLALGVVLLLLAVAAAAFYVVPQVARGDIDDERG